MNDSLHPWTDPELEARLVATILGEASDFESEEIDRRLKDLPELRVLKRRMEAVHGLLGDAARQQRDQGWKLPPTRRKTILDLLAPGKSSPASSPSPAGSERAAKQRWKVWVKYGAIAAVLMLLASLSVPLFGPMASRNLAFSSRNTEAMPSGGGDAIHFDLSESSNEPASSDPFASNTGGAAFPVTPATPTSFEDTTATDSRSSLDSLRGMLAQSNVPSDPLIARDANGDRFDGAITARSGRRSNIEVTRESTYPTEYEPPELPGSLSPEKWAKTTPPPITGGIRSGDRAITSGAIDGILRADPSGAHKLGGFAYRNGKVAKDYDSFGVTTNDPSGPTTPRSGQSGVTDDFATRPKAKPSPPPAVEPTILGGIAKTDGYATGLEKNQETLFSTTRPARGDAPDKLTLHRLAEANKRSGSESSQARKDSLKWKEEEPLQEIQESLDELKKDVERVETLAEDEEDRPEGVDEKRRRALPGFQGLADVEKLEEHTAKYKSEVAAPSEGRPMKEAEGKPGWMRVEGSESTGERVIRRELAVVDARASRVDRAREDKKKSLDEAPEGGELAGEGEKIVMDELADRGAPVDAAGAMRQAKVNGEKAQDQTLLRGESRKRGRLDETKALIAGGKLENVEVDFAWKLDNRLEGGTAGKKLANRPGGKPGSDDDGDGESNAPVLADVPLMGRLFKERGRNYEEFYAAPNDAPTVELKTELPKPKFVGTPVSVKLPNLERLRRQPTKPLLVPKGVTNVAKGKKVRSSETHPLIGELDMVTDGDKDGGDGSYVELGPDKQWVQIDLEKPTDIHGLRLWHYHKQARAYKDVVVEASNDPEFKGPKVIVFNNDEDNTVGLGKGRDKAYIETNEGRLIDARKDGRPLRARYVRIHSRGNTADEMNHYTEVEVYGKPADTPDEKTAKPEPPKPAVIETQAAKEPFSTFSLHVSDVSFKLAKDALAKNQWPAREKIRTEEFVNAFDYGDPLPTQAEKVACAMEQAAHPFMQQRNLLRVSMRTAATGRSSGTPLRLTLVLDRSGSMERADRAAAVRRAFAILASMLQPQDKVTLIGFARSPKLLADQVPGNQSGNLVQIVSGLPSEGGTNIEAALKLATEKAREQFHPNAQNRIILFTDGAANLGDAEPESLSTLVENMRAKGVAFDAGGFGIEGLNDEVLEALTRKGDGRYYVLDKPEDADEGFARQVAGALRPAARNVKVQVEFNPERVGGYKLFGFEKHRLKKEDFRNDKVDAAEMAAAEAGVAVYQVETKPEGKGDIGSVSVRFQDTSTGRMVEKRWAIPYSAAVPPVENAPEAIRIASAATFLAETLKGTPAGNRVELNKLPQWLAGLSQSFAADARIQSLQSMIETTRNLARQ